METKWNLRPALGKGRRSDATAVRMNAKMGMSWGLGYRWRYSSCWGGLPTPAVPYLPELATTTSCTFQRRRLTYECFNFGIVIQPYFAFTLRGRKNECWTRVRLFLQSFFSVEFRIVALLLCRILFLQINSSDAGYARDIHNLTTLPGWRTTMGRGCGTALQYLQAQLVAQCSQHSKYISGGRYGEHSISIFSLICWVLIVTAEGVNPSRSTKKMIKVRVVRILKVRTHGTYHGVHNEPITAISRYHKRNPEGQNVAVWKKKGDLSSGLKPHTDRWRL